MDMSNDSHYVERDLDTKEPQQFLVCTACPLIDQCTVRPWKKANCRSMDTDELFRKVREHLMVSSLHQCTDEEADQPHPPPGRPGRPPEPSPPTTVTSAAASQDSNSAQLGFSDFLLCYMCQSITADSCGHCQQWVCREHLICIWDDYVCNLCYRNFRDRAPAWRPTPPESDQESCTSAQRDGSTVRLSAYAT